MPILQRQRQQKHHFHATSLSSQQHRNARSPYRQITQAEKDRIVAARTQLYKSYTAKEKAELARRYTPEQVTAIEAGEAAVNPADLARSGPRVREDPLRPRDLDEHAFSRIQPIIDKRVSRLRGEGFDDEEDKLLHGIKVPTEDSLIKDFSKVLLDPRPNPADRPHNEKMARLAREGLVHPDWANATNRDLTGEVWEQAIRDPDKVRGSDGLDRVVEDTETPGREIDMEEIEADLLANPPPPPFPASVTDSDQADGPEEAKAQPRKRLSTQERLDRVLASHPDPPSISPAIPKINDPSIRWADQETTPQDSDKDKDGQTPSDKKTRKATSSATDTNSAIPFHRLSQQTGLPPRTLEALRVVVLSAHRVVNQTRMGKIASMYVLAVAGNEAGLIGLGEGSADSSQSATRIATCNAIRAMRPVLRYERRTVFGEIRGKCSAAEVTLSARPPGYGLRCSHTIFEMARCAGIGDLSARLHRSRNRMNVAKAAWQAMREQQDPEEVARARGRKMVDVRKVYYAGLV